MTYCYKLLTLLHLTEETREMKNISRGDTFEDFVTILTEGSMQDNKVASGCKTTEYKSADSPHCIKCNVLRE